MPRFSVALPLLSLLALAVSVACSPASSGKTCSTYVVPAATDLTTPVSFKSDIVGNFFLNHCAFSGCHGDNDILFLGNSKASGTVTNPADVYANIVNVPSKELLTMPYVTPGDASQSFVMRKVDGDNCMFAKQCKNQDCGDTMPHNNELLDVASRDMLRRWIAQGAKNN